MKKEFSWYTEFMVAENMELEVYEDMHGRIMALKTARLPLLRLNAE